MTRALHLRNRQQTCPVDLRLLRRMTRCLLTELVPTDSFLLGILLVGPTTVTRLNQTFLHHEGATDVITFDYAEPVGPASGSGRCRDGTPPGRGLASGAPILHGEIVICPALAMRQARRFRMSWQAELVRYTVHGVLHLLGYDDLDPRARRSMKRVEDRLVRQLSRRFPIRKLAKSPAVRPQPAIGKQPAPV